MPCGSIRTIGPVSGQVICFRENPAQGENPICVVREPDYEENRLVRTKTFSTHDEPKICHVVRESGVFTHGKNSHEGGVVLFPDFVTF